MSYCSSFDHTCCNKGLEEKLAKETNRNFKQDLDYVVTAQRMYCTKMKTSLPSEFTYTTMKNHYQTRTLVYVCMVSILFITVVSKFNVEDMCIVVSIILSRL